MITETAEYQRLHTPFEGLVHPWRKWGPYLSERAWGTVREDYSADGNAWDFLTHDLKIAKDRLWVTVHVSDDEAFEIWTNQEKIPADCHNHFSYVECGRCWCAEFQ